MYNYRQPKTLKPQIIQPLASHKKKEDEDDDDDDR